MRVERIELENWMSYPRRWVQPGEENGGEEVVPTIELAAQPLTLIAGDNGAGKSAILEAICYALFAKYPRGNNQDAIRSGETEARIGLHFSLPVAEGDAMYCVERRLSKKAGGTSAVLKQVFPDGSEALLQDGQSAVTDHIVERLLLGIEYESFVSTVFLRQDEAGRFMASSHGKQRQQLLRLCRLEFYRRIYDQARRHRRVLQARVADLSAQYAEVQYATEEHLVARRAHSKSLSSERRTVADKRDAARELLDKIQRAATLTQEIKDEQKTLVKWDELLGRAAMIRHAERWMTAWSRVEDLLDRGNRLHTDVAERVGQIQITQSALVEAEADARERNAEYECLETKCKKRETALRMIQDGLPSLLQAQHEAEQALRVAKEAKRFDEDISRIEAEQVERTAELAKFEEVRHARNYNNSLRQASTALQYAMDRLADARVEEQTAASNEIKAEADRKMSADLKRSTQANTATARRLEQSAHSLQEQKIDCNRKRTRSLDLIETRNQAIEAGVCPTCGTAMKGEVGEHVCEEVQEHEALISKWDERVHRIEDELEEVALQLARVNNEIEEGDEESKVLDSQVKLAHSTASMAHRRAMDYRSQAALHWEQHVASWQALSLPEWLETPSQESQTRIRKELAKSAEIEREYQYLTGVRERFKSEDQVLQRAKQRRAEHSVESPVTDRQLADLEGYRQGSEDQYKEADSKRSELTERLETLREERDRVKETAEAAHSRLSKLDRALSDLHSSQRKDEEYLSEVQGALQLQQKELEPAFTKLAAELLTALQDSTVYQRLATLASDYAKEAELLAELQRAESQSAKVKAQIEVREDQLGNLTGQIGTASEEETATKIDELETALDVLQEELNNANREIGTIARDCASREDLARQLDESGSEGWAFQTIEEAIYPGTVTKEAGQLFAHITRKLMESISLEASQILDQLGWHLAIAYGAKSGFSIEDRTLRAVRKYRQFSGGERFAIAVAVALAIGRVTHGAGNIRCLFIDEGFGALDQRHRKRIINDAIGKLIQIGSRDQVVVITHLRDMQEYFPSRIELSRQEDRSALAIPTEVTL